MFKHLLLLLILICMGTTACAFTRAFKKTEESKPKPSTEKVQKQKPSPSSPLEKVFEKYRQAQFVEIDVNKKIEQALLKKTKTSEGFLYLAQKGRFRLEIKEPHKSLVVVDGEQIWVVDFPLEGFDDTIQVMHSRSLNKLSSQAVLSFLLGKPDTLKHFKVSKPKKFNELIRYTLDPKEDEADLTKVEITIHPQKRLIQNITYYDSLQNRSEFEFKKQKFGKKIKKNLFTYKPPPNAEVSEF